MEKFLYHNFLCLNSNQSHNENEWIDNIDPIVYKFYFTKAYAHKITSRQGIAFKFTRGLASV